MQACQVVMQLWHTERLTLIEAHQGRAAAIITCKHSSTHSVVHGTHDLLLSSCSPNIPSTSAAMAVGRAALETIAHHLQNCADPAQHATWGRSEKERKRGEGDHLYLARNSL